MSLVARSVVPVAAVRSSGANHQSGARRGGPPLDGELAPLPGRCRDRAAWRRHRPSAGARRGLRRRRRGPRQRNGGWSTFSTAKRVRKAEVPEAPSCDLGLCLSPCSPPAVGERKPALRPGTPSMSSDESGTTTGGERDPVLLNLFV